MCAERSFGFPSADVHRLSGENPLAFHLLSSNAAITRVDISTVSEDTDSTDLIKTLNAILPPKCCVSDHSSLPQLGQKTLPFGLNTALRNPLLLPACNTKPHEGATKGCHASREVMQSSPRAGTLRISTSCYSDNLEDDWKVLTSFALAPADFDGEEGGFSHPLEVCPRRLN